MSKPNEFAVQRRWDWPYPIIARAQGIYLWDAEGRRYIDGSGGSSLATSIGHGVKEIPQAMAEQALDYSFYPAHAARDDIWETLRQDNAHFRAGHTLNASAVRGVAGDTILMGPPLITTKAQVDEMMAILHDSMMAFEVEVL